MVPLNDIKDVNAVTEAQLHAAALRGAILGLAKMPSEPFDLQLEHHAAAAEKEKSRAPRWIIIDPSGSENVAPPYCPELPGAADKERAKSKTHVFKLWVEPRVSDSRGLFAASAAASFN